MSLLPSAFFVVVACIVILVVLWNVLPLSLRAIDDITSSKKQLKTHLFRKAYFFDILDLFIFLLSIIQVLYQL